MAAVVVTATRFTEGGWLILVALPAMVLVMEWVHRSYAGIGRRLELGRTPSPPRPRRSLVVVPVGDVSNLTRQALATALSLGDRVIAVRVTHPDETEGNARFLAAWERWAPEVELVLINEERQRLVEPVVDYVNRVRERHVFVLIPEVEPEHIWQRVLQNQRGAVLAHALRRDTESVVCRLRFRLSPLPESSTVQRLETAGT
ncbi:hypothetical protein SMC26_22685 [Actinomadura fulvescens]|uniref:Uncharacterized protein n=1 Tax=Actinomadura fulvescens TaxID=46160 RepID=A0ABN3QNN9_9ACTN